MNERLSRISPTKSTSIRRKESDSKESTSVRTLKKHEYYPLVKFYATLL